MANAVSNTRRVALQSLGALGCIAIAAVNPAHATQPKQNNVLQGLFELFQLQWERAVAAARSEPARWNDYYDDCTAIARVVSMVSSKSLADVKIKEAIANSKHTDSSCTWGLDFETSVKLKLIAKAERSALIGGAV